MAEKRKLYLAGEWRSSADKLDVKNPYNDEVVATVSRATPEQIEEATARAVEAFEKTRHLPGHEREAILLSISQGLRDRTEEIARTMAQENGKPIRDARGEVSRAVNTFKFAAEEAKRVGGEVINLDWAPGSEGRHGIVRRFPIGPVLGITPFNFPLNLVAHKVAPAIAAGCPIVVKPASATPLSGLLLAEVCHEAGLPPGTLSLLPCSSRVAEKMVVDERFKKITFTGSTEVGLGLKAKAPAKHVTLELGGNAGVIVHSDADLDYAVKRCVPSSFYHAGQSCISVQRIFVHEPVWSRFLEGFLGATEKLKMGDPLSEDTDLGPMIEEKEARRVESWVKEALDGGAELLMGGKREGAFFTPTVLTKTSPDMKVSCKEVFAPVVLVNPYKSFEEAVRAVDEGEYGLQAGVFTRDLKAICYAYDNISAGGVIINDAPTYRIDHMPYGGMKKSGFGREGPKYAIEEMTERKLLVLNLT